jgi:hypothetical protein
MPKMPFIVGIRPEKRSKGLDSLRCCWHVLYQFCGLSAEIIVHAQNKADARVMAVVNFALAFEGSLIECHPAAFHHHGGSIN